MADDTEEEGNSLIEQGAEYDDEEMSLLEEADAAEETHEEGDDDSDEAGDDEQTEADDSGDSSNTDSNEEDHESEETPEHLDMAHFPTSALQEELNRRLSTEQEAPLPKRLQGDGPYEKPPTVLDHAAHVGTIYYRRVFGNRYSNRT